MLRIFNSLKPFFEDCYRELSVREYARMTEMSPPTASKLLKDFAKENLLKMREERGFLLFKANRESNLFRDLAKAYWRKLLANLFKKIHESVLYREMILFGSIAKVENTLDSDVDIYIDLSPKKINVKPMEKKLKRGIQLHFKDEARNPHLKANIKRGIRIL